MHRPTTAPPRRRLRLAVAATVAATLVGAAALAGGIAVLATSATAAPADISQGKAATASSAEGPDFVAGKAVDGSTGTRWASQWSDAQWIQVDLGATATLDHLELHWENAYAKAFTVKVSNDLSSWTTLATVTNGTGGTQNVPAVGSGRYVRLDLTQRATGYGYSLWELAVFGTGGATAPTHTPKPLPPAPPGADTSVTHHEFQANCVPHHTAPDDPIVFPGQAGASHDHTFMGNTTTNYATTTASLLAGRTTCTVPQDLSAYWFPTLMRNGQKVVSPSEQTIYYKAGILDYRKVVPFPQGLRFLVGNMMATKDEFRTAPGTVEGFECGESSFNWDIPTTRCPAGSQLNIRYQAPSCWNGVDLDSPNHKSHMAYPVNGECPATHPVPVPMIEFKLSWPVDGDLSDVSFASGRGYSFHYDFFNAWDPTVLQALVEHCINGGLQCNPRGFDLYKPWAGGVLDEQYRLIG